MVIRIMLSTLCVLGCSAILLAYDLPVKYWELDSARVESELESIEFRMLNEEGVSFQLLEAWSTLLLEFELRDRWLLKQRNFIESCSDSMTTNPMRLLYSPWMGPEDSVLFRPFIEVMGAETFRWQLALYRHQAAQVQTRDQMSLRSNALGLESLNLSAGSCTRWDVIIMILMALQIMALLYLLVKHKSVFWRGSNHIVPPVVTRLNQWLAAGDKQSVALLALSELELILYRDEVADRFHSTATWLNLPEKQQLIFFLLLKGHDLDDCAEYLQCTKGHLYNQRTALRKLFELPEATPLSAIWNKP